MFSNTAYEAFYTYLGLYLHSASIDIITSEKVLVGVIFLIFGVSFILMAWHFVTPYMPGPLVQKQAVPLSSFIKLVGCLFIGVSLLHVNSTTRITNFQRQPWTENKYIKNRSPGLQEDYKVSFIFDLLSRAAEETSHFFTTMVDKLFEKTNSETEAPSYFYKAIMYAGADNIDDPDLRDKVRVYADNCFNRVVPILSAEFKKGWIDRLFGNNSEVDNELAKIKLEENNPNSSNCLNVKNDVVSSLHAYARTKMAAVPNTHFSELSPLRDMNVQENQYASQVLVNYFWDKQDDWLGMQKGTQATGTAGSFFQFWHKLFDWNGLLSIAGLKDLQGANQYAERSTEFNELVQRAPHLAGIAKMLLIMIFPWLVFLMAAGKWRPIVAWYGIYCSVLLWAPIWVLFYHVMTSVAVSTEVMAKFGELSDGISLYASELITSRLYRFYSVYTWIQILSGPLPTVILGYRLMPWILDREKEQAPGVVKGAVSVGLAAVPGAGVLGRFRK